MGPRGPTSEFRLVRYFTATSLIAFVIVRSTVRADPMRVFQGAA